MSRNIALVTDLHEFAPDPVLEILREAKPDVIAVAGTRWSGTTVGRTWTRGTEVLLPG